MLHLSFTSADGCTRRFGNFVLPYGRRVTQCSVLMPLYCGIIGREIRGFQGLDFYLININDYYGTFVFDCYVEQSPERRLFDASNRKGWKAFVSALNLLRGRAQQSPSDIGAKTPLWGLGCRRWPTLLSDAAVILCPMVNFDFFKRVRTKLWRLNPVYSI